VHTSFITLFMVDSLHIHILTHYAVEKIMILKEKYSKKENKLLKT